MKAAYISSYLHLLPNKERSYGPATFGALCLINWIKSTIESIRHLSTRAGTFWHTLYMLMLLIHIPWHSFRFYSHLNSILKQTLKLSSDSEWNTTKWEVGGADMFRLYSPEYTLQAFSPPANPTLNSINEDEFISIMTFTLNHKFVNCHHERSSYERRILFLEKKYRRIISLFCSTWGC